MGLTCKPCGKMESLMKKLDNEMNGVKASAPKKSKKKEVAPPPSKKKGRR